MNVRGVRLRQRGAGLILTTLLALLAGGVLLGALLLGGAALWYGTQLPSLDPVVDYRPRQPLQVFTQDGVEIAQFGSERRQFLPIAEMPERLQTAVLAVEDTDFREHAGISWKGLARAVVANLTGGVPQGASTITQQVARTFFLSTRRTPERKIKEALLALQIERTLGKDQILELYLNQIYLGQRAYGFAAASMVYFGKPLQALSLAETAMLAGLPQNPIYANPVVNFERAQRRQRVVLQRMLVTGAITPEQHAAARAEKLQIRRGSQVEVEAQHVAEMARQIVYERFAERAYSEGIRVHTSLLAADQQAAHTALRRAVIAHERRQAWRGPEDQEDLPASRLDDPELERRAAQALKDHRDDEDLRVAIVLEASPREVLAQLPDGRRVSVQGEGLRQAQPGLAARASETLAIRRGAVVRLLQEPRGRNTVWSLTQWPQAEGAFVALDPQTGRVRALVGGFEFSRRQFNHVTQAWRQPGSSLKPFLYSAAFENGVAPDTLVNDAPLRDEDGQPTSWDPKNSDGRFDGPITVREALVRSKNLVSIRLLKHTGLATTRDWLARFGFDPARQPDNLTLALGAGSTTPLQLAGAYAVLANGGHRVQPVVIERITDARGNVIFEAPKPPPLDEDSRVVPARNVYLVDSLLADVTRSGTAAAAQAQLKRPDLYGKTGTTNDAVDAWFAGFHPSRVAVAWIGHGEPRSLGVGESGGGLALPAWIGYMARVLQGVPVQLPEPPPGLARNPVGFGDWRYAERLDGGTVERIDLEAPLADPLAPLNPSPPGLPASAVAGMASAPSR